MSHLDQTHKLPLFQKAKLIYQLVESLVASLPEEDEYIQATKHLMREDTMIIPAKIAGAEEGNLFSTRMQNAAIIREHAMHLYVQIGSLQFHKTNKDLEYIQLIRREIEAFRLLFVEWVKGFNTSNYIWDDWSLFNPPGAIPPIDGDNDEDINIEDFFDEED